MDKTIKARWLEALRSGEFEQSGGGLRSPHKRFDTVDFTEIGASYCCLGVLCELAVQDGVVKRSDDGSAYTFPSPNEWGEERTQHEAAVLPPPVQAWAGIDNEPGSLRTMINEFASLIELNDDAGYTFAQIADVIEQQF